MIENIEDFRVIKICNNFFVRIKPYRVCFLFNCDFVGGNLQAELNYFYILIGKHFTNAKENL
jgi:hypothetical protein